MGRKKKQLDVEQEQVDEDFESAGDLKKDKYGFGTYVAPTPTAKKAPA